MRNFLNTRWPLVSNKLRSGKHLFLRLGVRVKRALLNSVAKLSHFFRISIRRKQRNIFLNFARPEVLPARFHQGLQTAFSPRAVWRWHRWNNARVVVAVVAFSGKSDDFEIFSQLASMVLDAKVAELSTSDFQGIGVWLTTNHPKCDVVLVDGSVSLPDVNALLLLKHAAYSYHNHEQIGVVTPSHRGLDGVPRNIYGDRNTGAWRTTRQDEVRDYKQSSVARYVLGAQGHGAYVKNKAVRQFFVSPQPGSFDSVFNSWVRNIILSGQRVLEYSPARVTSPEPNLLEFGSLDWFFHREVTASAEDKLPIVFVLPATSMSGGIRAVLEKAEALIALGEDVGVWSLQGNPTWTDISFDVRVFRTYDDLTDALSLVNAIKVATWWETAEPVFLASMQRGVPVQYVQEFESWFYPDSASARAAVVSSYRPEFAYTTTASYQQSELAEIGIEAPIIPPAFDSKLFYSDESMDRQTNTLLALGRSFFQKNFRQTAEGWLALGEARPALQLFGFEPEILRDARLNYAVKPSDREIANLYRTSTVFIQTSLHEGFSLPLMEAMACGCPVITTDSHGNRDFCVDEVNCLMIKHGDVAGTAEAIDRLMNDSDLREQLSRAGIETAERYSWTRVARETQQMYRSFAEQSAAR